ncbi:response regulator [Spirochaeta lutea]|uniref:Histidine kinase n=1 Tax=Spirochaeta lutea TaxID=1480694 RepID=A0A098QZG2_9SPIO|nr:response regulator [Spirochaeta lutea]KGE71852.1 histidine kinase [Spirochaeta lutea]
MANQRVLYAEDEVTNRRLLQIQLQRNGITCDLASDGIQALELYRNESYGVIILDQYMPGMNGDQVAREILRDNPEAVLIAITSDDSELQSLEQAGFREVFIKPLRGKEYIEIIKSYL